MNTEVLHKEHPRTHEDISLERFPHIQKQIRDGYGLSYGAEYKFNEDGSINWRGMVKPEFLFVNKGWYEARKQTPPSSIDGLADHQLLIKLGGIKELAQLRGYTSVSYDVLRAEDHHVVIKCGIKWIKNYEHTSEVYFEDVANATVGNTSNFGVKFLETIATNRAFVRAVRNFLNIHIVGSDEIDSSKKNAVYDDPGNEAVLPSAQAMLEKAAKEKKYDTFEAFGDFIEQSEMIGTYSHPDSPKWKSYEDIPAKDARVLVSMLKA